MADWYVDYGSGSDAGAGSSGDPFQTIQYAMDAASYGDTIHLANTVNHVVSASLDTLSTGGSGGSSGNYLYMRPWDNGGSKVLQTALGLVTTAELVCSGDELFNTDADYVSIKQLYCRTTTSHSVVRCGTSFEAIDCRFSGEGGSACFQYLSQCRVFRCLIESLSGQGVTGSNSNALFQSCIIRSTGNCYVPTNHSNNLLNCILHKTASGGQLVNATGDTNVNLSGCTLIGTGDNVGIYSTGNSLYCYGNVLHNLATGVDFDTSAYNCSVLGGNVFSSVSTQYANVPAITNDFRSYDNVASVSFADPDNLDYTPSGLSGLTGAAGLFNGIFQSYRTPGAIEPQASGGGGGSILIGGGLVR